MRRRDFLKTPAAAGALLGSGLHFTEAAANNTRPQTPQAPTNLDTLQRMHPDFITCLPGVEYFFFGNGDITGVVQHCPKENSGTFLGFTFMNPGLFSRKWSTYLYHPERGLTNTRLGVSVEEGDSGGSKKEGMYSGVKGYSVTPENFIAVEWKYVENVPIVSLRWKAGECEIEEEFFAPSEGSVLFRRVNVRNGSSRPLHVHTNLSLYANFGLFDQIFVDEQEKAAFARGLAKMKLFALEKSVTVSGRYDVHVDVGTIPAGETGHATYGYGLNDGEKILKTKSFNVLWKNTVRYWGEKGILETGNKEFDHLWKVSKTSLRAVMGNNARMDAGVWEYCMEWVIDHLWAAIGFLRSGFVDEARLLVENNLKHAIGFDGRTIESSRWFGYDYTELNQNGSLVHSLWEYVCWTGDFELVRKYWDKIKLCADFPLQDVFYDKRANMVHNKREFWERSDPHGIEDGFEMAYQFWIIMGLEKGAELARVMKDRETEQRWLRASRTMKESFLNDPTFRMIENGRLIKRRRRNGEWQQLSIPPNRGAMPPGSPLATDDKPALDPDTTVAFPIIFGMIDPKSDLSLKTLEWVDTLWSQQWTEGGYSRYNTHSEPDPPAAWPFNSVMVARAHAEAGNDDKVWRVLKWLTNLPTGPSGSWFEHLGHSITPPAPPVGIVGWIWYELMALYVHQIVGLRPEIDRLTVKPHLIKGLDEIRSTHIVRKTHVAIHIRRAGEKTSANVNGKAVAVEDGAISIPYPSRGSLTIEFTIGG
ncbi:MAG TPA: hypothetical protein VMH23_03360 [Bacteroidota bacterium]|nr:hypothetical protein [Bacteroidota bacterium]